jgi:transposase-like protein
MCENLNLQIKRLTRVIGLSPNENSVLRLVTAVLIEASEEWKPANPTSLSSRHML